MSYIYARMEAFNHETNSKVSISCSIELKNEIESRVHSIIYCHSMIDRLLKEFNKPEYQNSMWIALQKDKEITDSDLEYDAAIMVYDNGSVLEKRLGDLYN